MLFDWLVVGQVLEMNPASSGARPEARRQARVLAKSDQQATMRAELRLRTQAAKLGFDLTPATETQP
jgi:hypothetical protein